MTDGVQLAGVGVQLLPEQAGTGTVSSGTGGQIAWYSSNGTTVSGNANATLASDGTITTPTLKLGANALAMSGCVRGAQHTVSGGEAGAHTVSLATGLTTCAVQNVQIIRSGKVATSDAAVSFSAGNLVVADGSTYVLTTNDIINWIAIGA